jgi:outer membrane protein OmpA-like peptidoglycan-associated protein
LPDTKITILDEPQIVSEKVTDETTEIQSSTTAIDTVKTDLPEVIQTKTNDYKIGDDLEKSFNIKRIYFAADKFNITNQASIELEKIVVVMNQYPILKIAILSHADCIQSEKYNLVLSEKRAKATLNWIVNRGINKSRLTSKGYGESQLVNKCADGVKCSEAEHQQNRRSTFVIVE